MNYKIKNPAFDSVPLYSSCNNINNDNDDNNKHEDNYMLLCKEIPRYSL